MMSSDGKLYSTDLADTTRIFAINAICSLHHLNPDFFEYKAVIRLSNKLIFIVKNFIFYSLSVNAFFKMSVA